MTDIIGLYNLEPGIINTALMQVSLYHKLMGHKVERYNHLLPGRYKKVYAFSIFDYTPKAYVRPEMICGGTGFSVSSRLPPKIESCIYDWSMYPGCDHSMIWFSRGCFRKCPFCVVPVKEGLIKQVEPLNLNPRGRHIKVMDNNFFGNPGWKKAVTRLIRWGQPVDILGIDVRIFTSAQGEALQSVRHHKQLKIAWDNPREDCRHKIIKLAKYVKPYNVMCYVLIGYWSTMEEDLYRVEFLKKIGMDPFVMPFDKTDQYQRDFARWCNNKAVCQSVPWLEYRRHARRKSKKSGR